MEFTEIQLNVDLPTTKFTKWLSRATGIVLNASATISLSQK